MTILMLNRDKMFTIFSKDDQFYLTSVTGGVAQYGITILLSEEEARMLAADPERAEKLAYRLNGAPDAFEDRRVRPSIAP